MNDKFLLMIQAALDSHGIKTDYNKLKQMLEKDPAKINAIMDMSASKTEINKFIKEYAPKLQEMFAKAGVKGINVKDIETSMKTVFNESSKAARQFQRDVEQAYKINESYNKQQIANQKKLYLDTEQAYKTNANMRITAEKQVQAEAMKTAKATQGATNLKLDKDILDNRISIYLKENSKLTTDLKNRLLELQKQVSSVDKTKLGGLNKEFQKITSEARATGHAGKNLFDEFKTNIKGFLTFVVGGGGVMAVINGFRNIVDEVKNIDSAMISLKKVTNETNSTYELFLNNTAQKAKELGASISDLVESTAGFARLGYNLPDASKLAEVATLYKNVGDGIDITQSTQSIISTLKAFNIEAENSISIVDKFNEVGNNFAISSAGIGTALQKSASAMASANNTLDESIALITAGNNVVDFCLVA